MIKVENVSKNYAGKTALSHVSFEIDRGTIFGLLGPNGAGKTSLIRILTQITGADEGAVYFDDEKLSDKHTSMMGYLPEERGLYKKMKIYEQAIYFAMLKGFSKKEAKKAVEHWFDVFDITSWSDKKVEELSKGMQQKVQFVLTILHEPKLLILDEPFTGFDPVNAEMIKKQILELKTKGTTIILSTHRMESVEELCDKIVFINNGKNILTGDIDTIKNTYKDNMVEAVSENGTLTLSPDFKLMESILLKNKKYKHIIEAPKDMKLSDVLKYISGNNPIESFKEVLPSINDIFIKLVNDNKE